MTDTQKPTALTLAERFVSEFSRKFILTEVPKGQLPGMLRNAAEVVKKEFDGKIEGLPVGQAVERIVEKTSEAFRQSPLDYISCGLAANELRAKCKTELDLPTSRVEPTK